jgi:hypothetical protein
MMDLQPHGAMLIKADRRMLNAIRGSAILRCHRTRLRIIAAALDGGTRRSCITVHRRDTDSSPTKRLLKK